jgi:hypothetical protein
MSNRKGCVATGLHLNRVPSRSLLARTATDMGWEWCGRSYSSTVFVFTFGPWTAYEPHVNPLNQKKKKKVKDWMSFQRPPSLSLGHCLEYRISSVPQNDHENTGCPCTAVLAHRSDKLVLLSNAFVNCSSSPGICPWKTIVQLFLGVPCSRRSCTALSRPADVRGGGFVGNPDIPRTCPFLHCWSCNVFVFNSLSVVAMYRCTRQ